MTVFHSTFSPRKNIIGGTLDPEGTPNSQRPQLTLFGLEAVSAIQKGQIEHLFLEKIARSLILNRKIKLFTRHRLVKLVVIKVIQNIFFF